MESTQERVERLEAELTAELERNERGESTMTDVEFRATLAELRGLVDQAA